MGLGIYKGDAIMDKKELEEAREHIKNLIDFIDNLKTLPQCCHGASMLFNHDSHCTVGKAEKFLEE